MKASSRVCTLRCIEVGGESSISRRVAQVYAPTQLTVGEPGADPAKNRLYINLVMVKKPEGWQIVSILPILVPPQ